MKQYIISLICSSCLLLSSCNYLDTEPGDAISSDHFWETANAAALDQYCNLYYPKLIKGHGDPLAWNIGSMISQEYQSDNLLASGASAITFGQNTKLTSNSDWNWSTVRGCNAFLQNYQKSDVYKRQPLQSVQPHRRILPRRFMVYVASVAALLFICLGAYYVLSQPKLQGNTNITADVIAVSYTHLDVYKRQENDRATIVPAIIFIFISSSILDLKIHPETECECSWGRIGSHVNTRVNVNAAVREGSTGRIHPLVPGYCKKLLTAESKPQISESRCLFGESV